MPQIVQAGSINTAALVVPDLYVQIVPPQNYVINGVPTNRVGMVGTASWGPVNQAVTVGDGPAYARAFGPIQARRFDLGTPVAVAIQQGASDFRCVRVTDGTDAAATGTIGTGITLTARYTGTRGNVVQAAVTAGSRVGTFRLSVGLPGQQAEAFDNLAPTWAAMVAAVNAGANVLRGPSGLVVATLGSGGATAVAPGTVTLTGGTDGATGVTSATVIGQDTATRTGMFSLRGQGCSLGVLADLDDTTQWSVMAAFGYSEGIYFVVSGPSGDTIATAVAAKQAAGVDDYPLKVMLGDWIFWNDPVNQVVRVVPPTGFVAGRLANLSPEQSSLNKAIYGIVSTQRLGLPGAGGATTYSTAELTQMGQAGVDVVTNPLPGGAYYGVRFGHNSSTDPTRSGDNYTRMTNFLASTVAAGMGRFIGRTITLRLFLDIRSTLLDFMGSLLGQGMLGLGFDGTLPFSVVADATNNPPARTGLGYTQADVQVRYLAINEKFIINLEGGTTVTVTRQTLPAGQR